MAQVVGLAAWPSAGNVLAPTTRAGGPPVVVASSGAAAGLHGLPPGGQELQVVRVRTRPGSLCTVGPTAAEQPRRPS